MSRTIYLLGEYSGLYTNLKKGLNDLGCKVVLVSNGDGFKSIEGDVNIQVSKSNSKIINNIMRGLYTYRAIKQLNIEENDIVQIINLNFFSLGFAGKTMKLLSNKTNNLYLSAVGDDFQYLKNSESMRYSPFQDVRRSIRFNLKLILNYYLQSRIMPKIKRIIPGMYDYAIAYRDGKYNNKTTKTIQFPLDSSNIDYTENKVKNDKVLVFHGLNREDFKGTKHIREAMEKIKKDYPRDVEIVIDGKMPLKDYLTILKEANVIIDQALSYSYGMNALYSMAMGKVVLSGNELECQSEFNRTDIPIINILPEADDIYRKIESLILEKSLINVVGRKSRVFVEEFHDHVKVAQMYLNVWEAEWR